MIRQPAVAGYFYPGRVEALIETLEELIEFSEDKISAIGIVVPHAGYIYSGRTAGKVYGAIEPPDVAIILGPNHTGLGPEVSLFSGEAFLTPLGEAKINKELSELLLNTSPLFSPDTLAHKREHSLEVQIPFLQYLNPEIEIVPICVGHLSLEEIRNIGEALAHSIEQFETSTGKEVLIVASSDFSHYEPQLVAKTKDSLAIQEILNLSEEGLLRVVYRERISMCGVYPVAITILASKLLGAEEAILVEYRTSGDITGNFSAVVGYGGIIIY